jgi:hypothetical protein
MKVFRIVGVKKQRVAFKLRRRCSHNVDLAVWKGVLLDIGSSRIADNKV